MLSKVVLSLTREFTVNLKTITGICLVSGLLICAQAQSGYKWGNVKIGGGGFVSSIVPSTVERNLFYARTDVGGAYRWDESKKEWIPLMDWVDASERGLLGVEAIMPDPVNANKVYMVCGTSYWNYGRTAFLRSSNKGDSRDVIYTEENGDKGVPYKIQCMVMAWDEER